MPQNHDILKDINSIYRYVFANQPVHRNTLRKKLLWMGKVDSKGKFKEAFGYLIDNQKLIMKNELVSINPEVMQYAVLQKNRHDAFVVTGNSKQYKMDKRASAGYKNGELLEIITEKIDGKNEIIVLGKSKNQSLLIKKTIEEIENEMPSKEQVKTVNKPIILENFNSIPPLKNEEAKEKINKENLVLGRVLKLSHDDLIFIPNDKTFPIRRFPILNNKEELASFQDKICVMELLDINAPLLGGRIVKVNGDAGNPVHEFDAISELHGSKIDWSDPSVKAEIDKIPKSVDVESLSLIPESMAKNHQKSNTVDLRHIPFVTVDPEDCKDMDDAIYSTVDENGDIVCYTAAASITKYVDPDSEIAKRYFAAGFTLYAPNKAYSILPSELSTNICSLNENENRLSLVFKFVLDKNTGEIKDSAIYDALIKSAKKYKYETCQEIVDTYEKEFNYKKEQIFSKCLNKEPLSLEEQTLMNCYAAQTIKKSFDKRKMIRFDSHEERKIKFDDDFQKVIGIEKVPHLFYNEVIEVFMLTANEIAAKFAYENNIDFIYRVHEAPNQKKTQKANEFFMVLGLPFDGTLSVEQTRSLIKMVKGTEYEEIVNNFLIKMQSKAKYDTEPYRNATISANGEQISHYALLSKWYGHLTAAIRRTVDYVNHYNLLAFLHETKPLSSSFVSEVKDIANEREDEVEQAEKDCQDISSVMYCENKIGEQFSGKIIKFRYTSPGEGYRDNVLAIVKNEDAMIYVEIPISQITGKFNQKYELSPQRCVVYDGRGDIVSTILKPVEFVISKADRKSVTISGKTNKELMKQATLKANSNYYRLKDKKNKMKEESFEDDYDY